MSPPLCLSQSIPQHRLINDLSFSIPQALDLSRRYCLIEDSFTAPVLLIDPNLLPPTKTYATGLLGDFTRMIDEQEWVRNFGSERLTAASFSFVTGALKCLPALRDGKTQKVLECGLDSASRTLRQKPPPVRFEVAPYFSGGAYFSFIVDWI